MFRWYVVNTYSGHENKVKHNLEHRVVSLNQQRSVRQIVVPTESVSEMKDNQKVTVERRVIRLGRMRERLGDGRRKGVGLRLRLHTLARRRQPLGLSGSCAAAGRSCSGFSGPIAVR